MTAEIQGRKNGDGVKISVKPTNVTLEPVPPLRPGRVFEDLEYIRSLIKRTIPEATGDLAVFMAGHTTVVSGRSGDTFYDAVRLEFGKHNGKTISIMDVSHDLLMSIATRLSPIPPHAFMYEFYK